ncbi:MAG TPA: NAD-dependent epimerase/dehydratase family protein [Flavobacterium sp.]|nr:NAD-dependent epimerase/dehydratase family protein [Flavobacterium sp.]
MILITGATGLTGSHLALHLLENGAKSVRGTYRNRAHIAKTKQVFALYRKPELFEKIEWVHADINDIPAFETAFENVDFVYHCAALISFDPNDEEKLRKTNIEGTANIVNLCLRHEVRKLCHVSSAAALGNPKDNEAVVTEETEWNPEKPHSDYGISKYGAEMEIFRGQQEGLNVVIVNPGIILGPPLWETGSSQLFVLIGKGQQFYTNGTMAFVSVIDVVKIMRLLMESNINGERFILASETLSYRKIFSLVADAMKKRRPSVAATPWMTSIAWRIDWVLANVFGQKRKISRDDARTLHTKNVYSNDKVKSVLGYEFIGVETAVEEIARLMHF